MNQETLEYLKDRYNEEAQRFHHIETKSGQLLSLLSILIGVFGAAVGFKSEGLVAPCVFFDWTILFTLGVTTLCLGWSWWFALDALRLGHYPVPNKSRKNYNYLAKVSDKDANEQIAECYLNTVEILSPFIENKAMNLQASYNGLKFGAISAAIFTTLLIGKELLK